MNKNKFPQTVQGAEGPTIFVHDVTTDPGTLTHELGHMLIDSPPNVDDHVKDKERIMNGKDNGDVGTKFIKEECSHIFDHIGQYGGKCK